MANCFGDVVDNYKLDEMERYVGKAKSQEDRAREAMNLLNEDGKDKKAATYVKGVKEWYGDGESTLCLVYNATGATLRHVADHDWWGFIGRTPYPTEIGNGQWAAFHHVHKTGDASGSEAAVVYRATNADGVERDLLVAWSTPWSSLYWNKAYCAVGGVDSFQGDWQGLYDKVNNADYTCKADSDGFKIDARTATGDSPIFTATIQIHFSE
uniref:Uncharacterized protein n=1 Tax=Oryza barthii TaxID=65489 RepID=A0A0D3GIY7_9ORYZ